MRFALRRQRQFETITPHPLDGKLVCIETETHFIGGICAYSRYFHAYVILDWAMECKITGQRAIGDKQASITVEECNVKSIQEVV